MRRQNPELAFFYGVRSAFVFVLALAIIAFVLCSLTGCAAIERRPALSASIAITAGILAAGYASQHGSEPTRHGEMPRVCQLNALACE